MANLGRKDGIYLIRFRYQGKEYKRSLKTRSGTDAEAAKSSIELTIHRLLTGMLKVPPGVEVGDFIVSGGTLSASPQQVTRQVLPPTRALIQEYLESQRNLLAESYLYSQKIHLRHFTKHLGTLADTPCDRVGQKHLEEFLRARLAIRDPNTVARERVTLVQFYKWVATREFLASYVPPATKLPVVKCGADRPPFRTIEEINRIIKRGGLGEMEILDLWECLYLSPEEIASLLATVRSRAGEDFSFLLHAIPAYTGMRRGEVLRLRWLDVDLDEDYLCARSRKQSRSRREVTRRIDLHPELKDILLDWRQTRPKGQFVVCDRETFQWLN